MNFFPTLLRDRNLKVHDGRPLWRYFLTQKELKRLKETLQYAKPYSIDPRDATLYYSYWWSKAYDEGKPSKSDVFNTIGGNIQYYMSHQEFYKLARRGADILGIKWIKKQNTLYFRTLLLQGGLPLRQISENHGYYKSFLEAVLREQPQVIEDFIFKPYITNLLPRSSQNEVIYENCLDIVKSIINDDDEYKELLDSEDTIKSIAKSLRIISRGLPKKVRLKKPKNYWLLSCKNNNYKITLKFGLADKYSKDEISNILGFEPANSNYQLFLDDDLICVFRRLPKGDYKTDWYDKSKNNWDLAKGTPDTYVLSEGTKTSLPDFIQTLPDITEPTLWSKFDDNLWRFSKSNVVPNKEALLLLPNDWYAELPKVEIQLYNQNLFYLAFEGEVAIYREDKERVYVSNVSSFDWTIESKKPNWLLKPNLKVVQGIPKIYVYDENGNLSSNKTYSIKVKLHNSNQLWEDIAKINNIDKGCYDIRIEKNKIVAYDIFYNIGNIKLNFSEQKINNAKLKFENLDHISFSIKESEFIDVNHENENIQIQLKTEFSKIPTNIKSSFGYNAKKKLFFDIAPFKGLTIVDKNGEQIDQSDELSISNLYGLRIVSSNDNLTSIRLYNKLKPDVIISKNINEAFYPLISFKDEIIKLFYLQDPLNHMNSVCFELSNGIAKKKYSIKGFSHILDISKLQNSELRILDSDDILELFAVPLNCSLEYIQTIPLLYSHGKYEIPQHEICKQYIVASSIDNDIQLMPRFINLEESYEYEDKDTRICKYHQQLLDNGFDSDCWTEMLLYFRICNNNDLPFSTFDQIRAISRSSKVAARAFFFLGINNQDSSRYIQQIIPKMERELGFCFHWIARKDWGNAIGDILSLIGYEFQKDTIDLIRLYLDEVGLQQLYSFVCNDSNIEIKSISHQDILGLRAKLGNRVLRELPRKFPYVSKFYNIPIDEHFKVKLLLLSAVAVSESILPDNIDDEYSIWGGDEKREIIRRNIQYTQYLVPEFYKKVIYHVLKKINNEF